MVERLHRLTSPLSEAQLHEYKDALTQLQGNILQGFDGDHVRYIFVRFREQGQQEALAWIRHVATQITSAAQQLNLVAPTPGSDGVSRSLLFAHAGYKYFFPAISGFPAAFVVDLAGRAELLKIAPESPSHPTQWQTDYHAPYHVMLILAGDVDAQLDDAQALVTRSLQTIAENVFVERALQKRLPAKKGHRKGPAIEHFGFRDGISQVLFIESDVKNALGQATEFHTWDPAAPLGLVLRPDPLRLSDTNAYGSYVVFQKIEQNVHKFAETVRQLAVAIDPQGTLQPSKAKELAGALMVGRFKDGTPVFHADTLGQETHSDANDFNYSSAPSSGCPLHSHIRVTNPRGANPRGPLGEGEDETANRMHLIARRGRTYGELDCWDMNHDTSSLPKSDVGLMFVCYQADIQNQFEFIQLRWANRVAPELRDLDTDSLIATRQDRVSHSWPKIDGTGPAMLNISDLTRVRGGAYFFAPSISFLRDPSPL